MQFGKTRKVTAAWSLCDSWGTCTNYYALQQSAYNTRRQNSRLFIVHGWISTMLLHGQFGAVFRPLILNVLRALNASKVNAVTRNTSSISSNIKKSNVMLDYQQQNHKQLKQAWTTEWTDTLRLFFIALRTLVERRNLYTKKTDEETTDTRWAKNCWIWQLKITKLRRDAAPTTRLKVR